MVAIACGLARAQDTGSPQLETNETYVENVMRRSRLVITDPMAVFDFVLQSLPNQVKVYPTENYYYFNFVFNGTPYAGNIRLRRMQAISDSTPVIATRGKSSSATTQL
jgi:hypothetical protein